MSYHCSKEDLTTPCPAGQSLDSSTCTCYTPCANPVPPIGFNKIADYNTFAECSAAIPELTSLGYLHVSCITDCPDPLGNQGMSHALSDTTLTCTPPKIMGTVVVGGTPVNSCINPPCPEFQTFDSVSSTCKCDDNTTVVFNHQYCMPDTNGDGTADLPTLTQDTDGDGIPDVMDSDSPWYGQCFGADESKVALFYGKTYQTSFYSYFGKSLDAYCGDKVSTGGTGLSYCDGAFDRHDKNSACVQKYCYIHDTTKSDYNKNPCQELWDLVSNSCPAGQVPTGYVECTHNGLNVTNNTIKCVVPAELPSPDTQTADDCKNLWNQVFNETTKKCECEPTYYINEWGDCWKSNLDANSTPDEIANDKNAQYQNAVNKDSSMTTQEAIDTAKANAEAQNRQLTTLSDSIGGLRDDLNGTNSALGDIGDDLNTSNALLAQIEKNTRKDNNVSGSAAEQDANASDGGSFGFVRDNLQGIIEKYKIDITPTCGTITSISANFHGRTLVFFSQSAINLLPMAEIKAFIIFLFTISALSIIFRTN
ncbi:MAG: hypothetical protein WC667_13175 [Sulfurimonas sp.]